MTAYIGMWIDRRKAHIVTLQRRLPAEYDYKQEFKTIASDVEPRVRNYFDIHQFTEISRPKV